MLMSHNCLLSAGRRTLGQLRPLHARCSAVGIGWMAALMSARGLAISSLVVNYVIGDVIIKLYKFIKVQPFLVNLLTFQQPLLRSLEYCPPGVAAADSK